MSAPTIQPIETEYAGCRFRSRLEARWAVFFDALQVEWRYEAQGYDLDGVRYLPDFYLPMAVSGVGSLGCHVEVKGELTLDDLAKLVLFAGTVGPILLVQELPRRGVGGPHFHLFRQAGRSILDDKVDVVGMRVSLFQPMPPVITIEPSGWPSLPLPPARDPILLHALHSWYLGEADSALYWRRGAMSTQPLIAQAFDLARSARFEHGESGAPRVFTRRSQDATP